MTISERRLWDTVPWYGSMIFISFLKPSWFQQQNKDSFSCKLRPQLPQLFYDYVQNWLVAVVLSLVSPVSAQWTTWTWDLCFITQLYQKPNIGIINNEAQIISGKGAKWSTSFLIYIWSTICYTRLSAFIWSYKLFCRMIQLLYKPKETQRLNLKFRELLSNCSNLI